MGWSLAVAVLGALASGLLASRLAVGGVRRPVEAYWAVGLAGLVPAWIVSLVILLGRGRHETAVFRRTVMAIVALAILATVATDLLARRRSGGNVLRAWLPAWLLGLVTLLPAWLLTLAARLWIAR